MTKLPIQGRCSPLNFLIQFPLIRYALGDHEGHTIEMKEYIYILFCKKKNLGAIALTANKKNTNSLKLNNLGIKNQKLVYQKKGKYINGGIYFFKKKILNLLPIKKLMILSVHTSHTCFLVIKSGKFKTGNRMTSTDSFLTTG